jgi:hypothetical protein
MITSNLKRLSLVGFLPFIIMNKNVNAHHAFAAEFSVDSPVEFQGVVTKVEMINPHSWIHLEVKNDEGENEDWMVEGGSPNALFRQGITKKSIPLGSEIKVFGYQARDGGLRAVGRTITFSDGTPLFFGGTKLPD